MTTTVKTYRMTCDECGFTTHDERLIAHHSCAIQEQGGHCEDYPACGHEWGDCNGQKYGSDEAIKEQVERAWATGHGGCDHAEGFYACEDEGDYEDEEASA